MSRILLRSFGACVALGLTACATDKPERVRPPVPSLVRDTAGATPTIQPSSGSAFALVRDEQAAPGSRVEQPTGPLTLQRALSLALIGNPELEPFSIEIRAAEARTLQVNRPPNPEIEFMGEDFGGSRAKRQFSDGQATLALAQVVELGAKRTKRVHLARSDETLVAWDFETKRLDVFVATKRAFTDVLAAQRRLTLAEASLQLERQLSNAVGERARAGQVSPLEQSRTQVTLSAGQVARDKALRNLQVARSRLAALWGGTHPTFDRALGDLGDVAPIRPLADLLRKAADNPDLARWTAEIEQRDARVALERARNIPDPKITFGARRYGYGTGETAFVAGLSIPLAFYSINEGNLLDAQLQANKGRALQQQAATRVASAIEQVHERLSAAYDTVLAIRRSTLPAAETTFGGMSTGYREGKFTLLEVIDAQRTLLETRIQLIEAEAAYQSELADAERLTSQSPTNDSGRTTTPQGAAR